MSTRQYEIHPYRLSEHTINTLNSCERKFQLNRLLKSSAPVWTEDSVPSVRGHAWGVAVQEYILHGNIDKALFTLWLNYHPEVYDERKKIYLWRAVNNFLCAKDMMDKIRNNYRVAQFNGKPAVELSFRLDLDDKWHFVGYIDLVLQNIMTHRYAVLEVKTTTYNLHDLVPVYKNSGQALGYSIALDRIVGEDQSQYEVLYFITRDKQDADARNFIPDTYLFPFTKTLLDRLRWFYTLELDRQRLNTMLELGMFPMRGSACVSFNRVCEHFGTCNTTAADITRPIPEEEVEYDFRYKLDEVIQDHLIRVSDMTALNEIPQVEVTV